MVGAGAGEAGPAVLQAGAMTMVVTTTIIKEAQRVLLACCLNAMYSDMFSEYEQIE